MKQVFLNILGTLGTTTGFGLYMANVLNPVLACISLIIGVAIGVFVLLDWIDKRKKKKAGKA